MKDNETKCVHFLSYVAYAIDLCVKHDQLI